LVPEQIIVWRRVSKEPHWGFAAMSTEPKRVPYQIVAWNIRR